MQSSFCLFQIIASSTEIVVWIHRLLTALFLMYRLAMNQLPGYCGLFEGRQGYMMFAHNIKLIEQNKYFLAGRLVGMSLTQGGPGICCFHPLVYGLMCGLSCDLSSFELNDIVDPNFAELIAQVQ